MTKWMKITAIILVPILWVGIALGSTSQVNSVSTFNEFIYDPGSGTPGSTVTDFPVLVDGKTRQLWPDIRGSKGSIKRPSDGRGLLITLGGERTELNLIGDSWAPLIPNDDEHWYGAVGIFGDSIKSGWELQGQWRHVDGGHPAIGVEWVNGRFFLDVRAYDKPVIGQAAKNYPAKPGTIIPSNVSVALRAHIKFSRSGQGIILFQWAGVELKDGKYILKEDWKTLVNQNNIAVGYSSGAGYFLKLFFSKYSGTSTTRSSILRLHAAAKSDVRLDELMKWHSVV